MIRDLRYAVRSLLRDRGSVALAVLALSLAIGSTTVIISVVYSVLVNSFPFVEHDRVVHFFVESPDRPDRSAWYAAPEFDEYRRQNQVFSDLLGGASHEVLYNLDDATYRVRGTLIDPRALRALGVRPILGRDMTDEDGAPDAPPTFLMSDRMWQERFNRDPDVLGMTLNLNGTMRTLIAVLPARVLIQAADVLFPTTITAGSTDALVGGRGGPLMVWTYGRLKPGVTREQAAANVEVIARNLSALNPRRYPDSLRVSVMSLAERYTAPNIREMVYILAGAVLMLLLIACSNVGNLLLARATARETELAVRASLGASRARLAQQLLAESLVLVVAGTAIGGALAFAGLRWVRAAIPVDMLPAEMAIQFSGDALVATIAVALTVTLLCGLAPALKAGRGDLQARLMGAGKGTGLRTGHGWLRTVFVILQVTLAIVLLVGAGLMMRTLMTLQNVDLGLDTTNVMVGSIAFPRNWPDDPPNYSVFMRRVIENVSRVPGVEAVSPSWGVPLQAGPRFPVAIPGASTGERLVALVEIVNEQYFAATGLPLLRGQLFSYADVEGARRVAVVNDRFAREFLAGADPIGRTVTTPVLGGQTLFEIVGVVADARNAGLEDDPRPQIFLPYTTGGLQATSLVMKTSVPPLSLQHAISQQIWNADRGVAFMNVMTLDQVLHRNSLAAPRFGVGLLGTFAAIGLILSAIGVFSVMAYTVSLRTHDIGVRMALGAQPEGVLRMMIVEGMKPILAGLVCGLAASYALSRVMANQIYGVGTTDPWTFAGVAIVLLAVGIVACLLPARRATRVDPLIALRSE